MSLINYFNRDEVVIKLNGPPSIEVKDMVIQIGREFAASLSWEARRRKIPTANIELVRSSRMNVIVTEKRLDFYFLDVQGGNLIQFLTYNGNFDSRQAIDTFEEQTARVMFNFAVTRDQNPEALKIVIPQIANSYMKEHDTRPGLEKASVPREIAEGLERFRRDYPSGQKTAFIIMSFHKTPAHDAIVETIRKILNVHNIRALRADGKEYMDDLLGNIRTYMHGCDFGIAVFERIMNEHFNPNVSLEVGYMNGLGKNVLLLKDQTLQNLQTDLVGRLYKAFDPQAIADTLPKQIESWLRDKERI